MAKNSMLFLQFKNVCAYDCDRVSVLSRPFFFFFGGGGGGAGGILSAPILNLNNIFIIFKNAIKPLGFCRNLSPYSFM